MAIVEELIGKVFATRNAVHLAHWKTKSYAEHQALGSFYEALIDKLDAIVEAYQGAFGLVKSVDIPTISESNLLNHLDDEVVWIDSNREKVSKKVRAIENLIDELTGEYLSTIYKLRNLK